MKDEEFRDWLRARRWNGKPITSAAGRMADVRRFEKAMPALGLPWSDLDAAYESDGMAEVTATLKGLCKGAVAGDEMPSALVGDTTIPRQRINKLTASVRNYRQFRERPVSEWPALDDLRDAFRDRVPEFERFTETDNEYERVERRYKDEIAQAARAIIASPDSEAEAGRRLYKALMPDSGPLLRWQTADDIDRNRAHHAARFYGTLGALARSTGSVIDAIMTAAATLEALRDAGVAKLTVGEVAAITITIASVARPSEAAPFKMTKARALARLLTEDPIFRGNQLTRAQVEQWLSLLQRIFAVMRDGWAWEPRDLFDVQGFAWAALDEDWGAESESDSEITREAVEAAMDEHDRLGQAEFLAHYQFGFPREYWVLRENGERYSAKAIAGVAYGFMPDGEPRTGKTINGGYGRDHSACNLLEGLGYQIVSETSSLPDLGWNEEGGFVPDAIKHPLNQILYGPPGTGKTYHSARLAVEICNGSAPSDRALLMEQYGTLLKAKRIEFTTFHQSIGYEEFVEGLRPTTEGPEGGEEGQSGGFDLVPRPGIFKRIAGLAEAELTRPAGGAGINLKGRKFFKMSLGESASEVDVYDAAIAGNYVALRGGDEDWSDPKYDNRQAIVDRWQAIDPDMPARKGHISQLSQLRTEVLPGSIVIVPEGNTSFRAIGLIEGDYYKEPSAAEYAHRRKARWLRVFDKPQSLDLIVDGAFTMRSLYSLSEAALSWRR